MGNEVIKQIVTGQSLANDFVSQVVPIGPGVDNVVFNIEMIGVTENTGSFKLEHRIFKDAHRYSAWGEFCVGVDLSLSSKDEVKVVYLAMLPIGQIRLVFTVKDGETPDGTCDIWYSGRNL